MKRWVLFLPVVVIAIIFISESPLTFGFCKHIDAVTYATPYCLDGSLLPEYVSQIIAFLSLSNPSLPPHLLGKRPTLYRMV